MTQLNPAEYVIHKLGGIRAAGRLLNISHAAVHKWKSEGNVPTKRHKDILTIAKDNRLRITPKNLIYGGTVSKPKKGK